MNRWSCFKFCDFFESMGNFFESTGNASKQSIPVQDGPLVGTWVQLRVAKAMSNPGRKMMGSAADFTPKWKLVVKDSGEFLLTCVSGYDFRGRMSSSGMYDGEVSLKELSVKGNITEVGGSTRKLSVKEAHTKTTTGKKDAFAIPGGDANENGEISEGISEEARGYDITAHIDDDGGLSIQADKINGGKAISLTRV